MPPGPCKLYPNTLIINYPTKLFLNYPFSGADQHCEPPEPSREHSEQIAELGPPTGGRFAPSCWP